VHLAALATLDGAALVGVEPSAFRKRLRRHNELFASNPTYATTLGALAQRIVGRPEPTPFHPCSPGTKLSYRTPF
jgi:hypothetical protein